MQRFTEPSLLPHSLYNTYATMPFKRYRNTQEETLEDYISRKIDECDCENCTGYKDCLELFGENELQCIKAARACSGWDASIETLTAEYEKEFL